MASTAIPQHSTPPAPPTPSASSSPPGAPPAPPPTGSRSEQMSRMDQFLAMSQHRLSTSPASAGGGIAANTSGHMDTSFASASSPPPGTSATSGSNSGEEDDSCRDISSGGENGVGGSSNKRLGSSILNGLSSKKRRKQSKPIKIGAEAPEPGQIQPFVAENEAEEDGEKRGELPLNLSGSSRETGDGIRPVLRVLGPELMAAEEGAKAAAAAALAAGEAGGIPPSLYQSMLPFGLPPFPFPMPNVSGMKRPATSSSPISSTMAGAGPGGRIQIFNPEAYCELCNKEFCNKYFLKTHKANKHGIYSESPSTTSSGSTMPPSSSSSSSQANNSSTGQSSSQKVPSGGVDGGAPDPVGGPPTPNSQAGSPFSGAFIAANMGSLRPPFLPLSPGASPSPTSSSQNNTGSSSSNLGPSSNNKPITTSAPSVNNIRDVPSRDGSDPSPRPPGAPPIADIISPREADRTIPLQEELRKSLESPRSLPGLPPQLAGFNPMMFGGLPSLEALRKEEEQIRAAAAAAAAASGGGVVTGKESRPIPNIPNVKVSQATAAASAVPKGPFTPEKLRQMGVINADAFCEICCKEFCNKYFLRVHKLKKHGICSPDLPPEKVQKILSQMAKEAGKTGNPPPPIIRPGLDSRPPQGLNGPAGSTGLGPLGLPPQLRPPSSVNSGSNPLAGPGGIQLPPLEPLLPQALKDFSSPLPNALAAAAAAMTSESNSLKNGEGKLDRPGSGGEKEVIRINDDSEDSKENDQEQGLRDGGGDANPNADKPSGSNSPTSQQQQRPSEDLQRLQSMIMELNSNKAAAAAAAAISNADNSTVCKVCNKDMENKYFLRAHMMNEHGVLHMEEPPQLPIDPSSKKNKENEADNSISNGDNPIINTSVGAGPMAADFASKFLQQMQKGLGPGLPLDSDELSFLERVKSELASGANSGSNANNSGSPNKKAEKDPNRKPASLSRSYCEICKKELCNKYFMKTHMMKMHGINIEATGPAGSNAGVSCHLCKKELCSKYFLKVHLQNTHGIMEDGSPVPPGLKDNGGGGGSGLFPGLFPPPPELLGFPGPATSSPGSADKDRYFSRLLGEQSEISRERLKELERQKQMMGGAGGPNTNSASSPVSSVAAPGHTCSLCGEGFPEIVALQVHIIKSHGAFPPESGLFGNKPPTSTTDSPTAAAGGSEGNNGKDQADKSESAASAVSGEASTAGDKDKSGASGVLASSSSSSQGPLAPSISTPSFSFPPLDGSTGGVNAGSLPPLPPIPASSSSSPSSTGDSAAAAAAAAAAKQFPHIEMLQRHMLSQQFPGLMGPLLSAGFPGFPGVVGSSSSSQSPGSSMPFSSPLQQFLTGMPAAAAAAAAASVTGVDEASLKAKMSPNTSSSENNASPSGEKKESSSTPKAKAKKVTKKRFKCSKCGKRFRRRELCLEHIHQSHSTQQHQIHRVSPLKVSSRGRILGSAAVPSKTRSQYVRQLMELLRVPTSRGTPSGTGGEGKKKGGEQHIMQPFLLKAPSSPVAATGNNSLQPEGESNSNAINDNNDHAPAAASSSAPENSADININFVPSLVYLPVAKRVSQPLTVAFSLTPA